MKIDFTPNHNTNFAEEALGWPSYPLDKAVVWVQDNLSPEEVFTEKQLETWAFENGFKKFE